MRLKPSLDWLLAAVPVAIGLELAHAAPLTVFLASCLAIIPLAGLMGRATEHLAERTGEGLGGLLISTFGNAAELIIALVALRRGLIDVVKASLTGSIIGNILLVLGASMLAGGLRHPVQRFNPGGARSRSTMLLLAAIALVAPAVYHHLAGPGGRAAEGSLSTELALVLLATYAASLLFALRTHRKLFEGPVEEAGVATHGAGRTWSLGRALGTLLGATAVVAWIAEILVGSVEAAAARLGMSELFVGVVVVAVIGNAAENSSAILMARKNRMDLSLGIAIGSSIQIALFVAPVLVLASRFIAPRPMDLVFTPAEVIAVVLAVLITTQIAGDGESHWLEGVQLLAVYLILAILFYFLPAPAAASAITAG
jgi:Ca2+:H+ antiporter